MAEDTLTKAQSQDGRSSDSSQFVVFQISLPKSSGGIRGIGEEFATNPTGTGSRTAPIALSPGGSGFGPNSRGLITQVPATDHWVSVGVFPADHEEDRQRL